MNTKQLHKKIMFFLHAAIVLGISYLIVSCFMLNTKSLSFFSVLDESGDVPMSDMYLYINSNRGTAKLDTNIILVSVDSCRDRLEIAQLIEQIDSMRPKVIGLDVFFQNWKEPKTDTILANTIRKSQNMVIACVFETEQIEDNDRYNICKRNFFVNGKNDYNFTEGFINLDSDGNSTVQTFTPKLFLQKENSLDTLYCFSVQTVRLFDETSFRKLLQRKRKLELINFQPLHFNTIISKNEIEDYKNEIANKIVLIGSLSEDVHKTPINSQMHGIEIHAHTISTIIDEQYIDRIDNVWTKLINILFCYLFTLFCWFATTRLKKGVSVLIKLVQVTILFLAFLFGYYFFNRFNIDIVYTRTIIVTGIVILIVDLYSVGITFGRKLLVKINTNFKNKSK